MKDQFGIPTSALRAVHGAVLSRTFHDLAGLDSAATGGPKGDFAGSYDPDLHGTLLLGARADLLVSYLEIKVLGTEISNRDMAPARRIVNTPPCDYVSRLTAEWQHERPDFQLAPVAIVYRLFRLAGRLGPEVEKAFTGSGVSNADFSVLAILRRRPAPYRISQKFLQEALGITSGTISVRIDRLVDLGLVIREIDEDDARSVQVLLTSDGERVFDALAPKHLENEAGLVSSLDEREQNEMARLLQMLLSEFEPLADPPGRSIGMSVLSAHTTRERRTSVGLGNTPGLLIEDIAADSPADRAGLRKGDLIVRSGTMQVRSLTCLQTAIGLSRRELPLTVQRGDETVTLKVSL